MENGGSDTDSAAESSGSARRKESSSGDCSLDLSCLPERYRTAKFSLAAHLLCWVLLRWFQKLRCQSAPLQVRTFFF
ncbi:hypothetical protein VZT92_014769 [Zoarces viviparus]|uniref:Uncharacterized protein n=1 Tax=Zoarces viviparus TaxID=48416 RepID=A0AAW1F1L6_ZOAVI